MVAVRGGAMTELTATPSGRLTRSSNGNGAANAPVLVTGVKLVNCGPLLGDDA
jgi:hypothetical protein